jgi:hypothetical protein
MQILGGRARGMNEAERLRRMQKQQNFDNAYRLAGMQDRMAARKQARADQNAWNAYNAALQQGQMQNDYEFDIYDRAAREEQQQWNRGMRERQMALRETPMAAADAGSGGGRLPLDEAERIAEMRIRAQSGDPVAADALDYAGLPVPQEPGKYPDHSSIYNAMPEGATWYEHIPFVGMPQRGRRIEFLHRFGPERDRLERRIKNGTASPEEFRRFQQLTDRAARYISGEGPDLSAYELIDR